MPTRLINEIVHGKRAISPDTALRLSRALGISDRFWMNPQSRYNLDIAVAAHAEEFDRIKLLLSPRAGAGPPVDRARTPVTYWHLSTGHPNRIRTGVTAVRGPIRTLRRPLLLWNSANLQSSESSTTLLDNVGIR
ncbi:MAG TPA: HigA family addiction module antitoxin [Galbitalea sp.]|nr:HigA family addiction module antitoxin [Galbitalea sp.]